MSLITEDNALGNGSNPNFSFTFKYVKESDVYVSVDDVVQTLNTHYTFSPNTSSITFLPAHIPGNQARVRIFRETALTEPAAEFFPGSAIRAQDLNANNDQVLFSAQERKERSLDTTGGTITGNVTVNGDVIFEGLTEDANETTLTVVDPTQDNTITLPNASGHVPLLAATSTTQIAVTPADINKVGPVTDGTVTASKAVVVDANKDITGLRNVTMSGNLDVDATANLDAVDIDDNVDLGANLNFTGSARVISAVDNNAAALTVTDGADTYLTFDTTTGADKVVTNKTLNVAGNLEIAGTQVTSSATDLNIVDGMTKSTTLVTSSDTEFPTSKAVADWVNTQLDAIDGFVAIANENSFPNTQPPDQVTVSIADAGGIAVNGSGVGTGQTAGGATVTINNFASNFHNTTIVAGVRLLVESTGSGQIYNYHKATLKEADLVNLSDDIQDFGERYRVGPNNPTTNNDGGDLFFNTGSNKMLVYNATNTAWEEVQSIGQFFEIPSSELADFANGVAATETISNAPATAQQIILSINGVIQKPSSGTGTPAEGFTLSGATITLAATPPAGSTVFGVIIGSSVNVGTPSAGTVDTLQLADDGVNNDKLDSTTGAEAVNTNVIRDNAITSAKIADDQVTEPKLGTSSAGSTGQFLQKTGATTMNWATVDTSIADDSITEPKLATDNAGSTGQYLQKTATGMDWAALVIPPAVPTGSVHMFAMAAVPSGYLVCEGQNVSRTTYADLFSAIGTTFGAGDGSTTFALPDLRNEFIRGADPSGGRAIGATEADATAVNGLGLTDPGHFHGINTTGVGNYVASALPRGYTQVMGTATSNSATTGITLSSTDTETRPQNVALLYAIKT